MIICAITMYLTTELVETTRVTVTGTNASMDEDHLLHSNDTFIRCIRRAAPTTVVPTRGLEENIITIVEGSFVQFKCNPFERNCPGCGERGLTNFAQVYFCKEPCKWIDVKAYTNPTSYGTDERFRVAKNNRYTVSVVSMTVSIEMVKLSDQGKYFCGINRAGKDWYEAFALLHLHYITWSHHSDTRFLLPLLC